MEILFFIYHGIIAGIIYLLFAFLRGSFNYTLALTIPLDIIWGILATLTFGYCLITNFSGVFKLYQLLGFIIGLIIVKISLGNLVASLGHFVYNKIVIKITKKLKIIIRGIFNGTKKVNKASKINN